MASPRRRKRIESLARVARRGANLPLSRSCLHNRTSVRISSSEGGHLSRAPDHLISHIKGAPYTQVVPSSIIKCVFGGPLHRLWHSELIEATRSSATRPSPPRLARTGTLSPICQQRSAALRSPEWQNSLLHNTVPNHGDPVHHNRPLSDAK